MELYISIATCMVTFLASFAVFVWWISTKFFGLREIIKDGLFKVKDDITIKMNQLHTENLGRFNDHHLRLTLLEQRERKDNHGVRPSH